MDYDVVVVGAGNAAHAAAVAAREAGAARVLMLEKSAAGERGGNTHYSGGLLRFAFEATDQLRPLVPRADADYPGFFTNAPPYPPEAFRRDLIRVTEGRTDPALSNVLVRESYDTVHWMHAQGIAMEAAASLSAVRVGDAWKWPSGAVIRAAGEGRGLSRMWFEAAARRGIDVRYETGAQRLLQDARGRVIGVGVRGRDGLSEIATGAVVLGCGGFEANAAWRARYLGRPWDTAKVRGTRFNTGDGLEMALAIGALPHGQWSGSHGTPIDAGAPDFGDRELTDKTNRLSYPFGVMVNARGRRFVDEGEDFPLYTYARTGGTILGQPGGIAYQIFDGKVLDLLEPRYATGSPVVAETLEELLRQIPLDGDAALRALGEYNASAGRGRFDPSALDGLRAPGIEPEKSNWAQPLDTPPFRAYPVTGGITFTFGGLRVTDQAQVMAVDWRPIAGLYACGEMVGGLFHSNYPGGAGLVAGAVFGRIAGHSAAQAAH